MIRSLFKITQNYTQVAYSRFKISRTPEETMLFFFKNQITVAGLLESIKKNFNVKDNVLLVSSAFSQTLIGFPIMPEAVKATEQVGPQLLIPLLISGELFIYQATGGRVQICYGVECQQFNQTNNRNLPERISNGIIELNSEWISAKTVGDALNNTPFHNTSKEEIEEIEQLKVNIEKSYTRLQKLNKFVGEYYAGSPTHRFTVRMLAIMSLNWGFLFAITYGKYGWDVGEPVSYLTALGVDLAAMVGFFNLDQKLQHKINEQQGKWWASLNIQAQKRSQQWLLSYHRRQFY